MVSGLITLLSKVQSASMNNTSCAHGMHWTLIGQFILAVTVMAFLSVLVGTYTSHTEDHSTLQFGQIHSDIKTQHIPYIAIK